MAKRRKFTPEFKAEVVLEVLSGATSQAEVCRCHNTFIQFLLFVPHLSMLMTELYRRDKQQAKTHIF